MERLKRLHEMGLINMKGVCESAGLRYNSIYIKMMRGGKLSKDQKEAIDKALNLLKREL